MIKFLPLQGKVGAKFWRVWLGISVIAFFLWLVSTNAKRVHTDLYLEDSLIKARVTALEGK